MIYEKEKDITLFTKFKRNATTLFLDPVWQGKQEYKKGEKFNIILSPSLYWVKKVQLPVKYLREVKKLLPSIFEEILPDGHFSYSAFKEGDSYYIFAYEDKKILALLEAHGIHHSNIAGVYFAQGELDIEEQVYQINETQVIYAKDDIVIVAPKIWFATSVPLDLQNHKIHSQSITLQQYGHIVNKGALYKISGALVVLIAIIGTQIMLTHEKINYIESLKENIFTKYKLYPTMMQNRAILAKYEGIYEIQTKLRGFIALFLKLPLKKSQKIVLLEYDKKRLHVKINGIKKEEGMQVFNTLTQAHIKYKTHYTKSGVIVEVAL
jgi:hypothetical protein